MAKSMLVTFAALLGAVYGQAGYNYGSSDLQVAASSLVHLGDPIGALSAIIPGDGVPGVDYPILAAVPDTGFLCEQQQFPGYYADTNAPAACQVFHICQFDGRQDSFLCPNGTLFNQQFFVCDWWFNVDCAASSQFVSLNADIGRITEQGAASNVNQVIAPGQLYGSPKA